MTKVAGNGQVVLTELIVNGNIGANLAGSDDAIKVDSVTLADIGGDVLDGVTCLSGTLEQLLVGDDIQGDVTATNGSINLLDVTGSIGIGSAVNIRAKTGIKQVIATSIWADINARYNNGTGNVQLIQTTGGASGDFVGSVLATNLASQDHDLGLDIDGDLDADLTFTNDVQDPITIAGDLLAGRTISIGRSLRGDNEFNGDISLSSLGLAGQIIINANNDSGAWNTATVTVGATQLSSTPYYTQASSGLGGGAVGLAPWHMYNSDCSPVNGFQGDLTGTEYEMRVSWYGPLHLDSDDVVTVKHRSASNGTWVDVTDDCDIEIDPSNPRWLIITAHPEVETNYMAFWIEPTSDLQCAGVSTTPPVYPNDDYIVIFD